MEARDVPAVVTYSVNTNADTPDVVGDNKPEDAFGNVSLRSIIEFSNQPGNAITGAFGTNQYQVSFDPIAGQTISLTNGALPQLQSNFNFLGAGVTIERPANAAALFRLFDIKAGTTSQFFEMTLQNGSTGFDGGAINNGGGLIVNNCTFINNSANGGGGAIASLGTGTQLQIGNSGFWLNSAGYGGAIAAENTEKLVIDGCEIFSNDALAIDGMPGHGGGIYVKGYTGDPGIDGLPTITQSCRIYNNTAGGNGGGVFVQGTSLNMSGGQLQANGASGDGGGIFVDAPNKTINLTNVTIVGNSAGGKGGGAYIFNGVFDGSLAALINNSAVGGIPGIAFKKNQATTPITFLFLFKNQQAKVEDP